MNAKNNSQALVVPTLNAEGSGDLNTFLNSLEKQDLPCLKVLFVDSQSDDHTVKEAKKRGIHVHSIQRKDFDHGKTRQLARQLLKEVEFIIYMTQDAYLADENALKNILIPFKDPKVALSYGRQIPKKGHGPFASHSRFFNYPAHAHIYSLEDHKKHGMKVAFSSNCFACYRTQALDAIGGFPRAVLGEDIIVAAKLILSNWKIAYTADASVYHSHEYSLKQEFRQHFDYGTFHKENPWITQRLGKAEKSGMDFALSELSYIAKKAPWLLPLSFLRSSCKYLAFQMGKHNEWIPLKWRHLLSRHPLFWLRQN